MENHPAKKRFVFLLGLFLPFLIFCQAPREKYHLKPRFKEGEAYLNISSREYRAPVLLYQIYAASRHLIPKFYQEKLFDESKLEKVLEIIDENDDRYISFSEASSAYFSTEKETAIRGFLDTDK